MGAPSRAVEEGDFAHMFLDDLLDDGEAQSGAAYARRDIGLGDSFAVLGQADASIEDVDHEQVAVLLQAQLDAVARHIVLAAVAPALNGFDAVLDDIGKRLAKLAAVADHWEITARRVELEGDRGMRDLVQEQRLARDLEDVGLTEHRLWHAREIGEFIDHPAQVANLPDNRPGELLERLLVLGHLIAEAALEPFRGQLDRGQRVLDFMRDSARDIRPGGAALIAELVGDVVEGEDAAVLIADPLDRKRARAALGRDQHVRFRLLAAHEFVELGRDARQLPPLDRFVGALDELVGRAVDEQDLVGAVERDNPGGDTRQHRLDEGAAGLQLGVGGLERAGLLLEPPGHAVERARQHLNFILGLADLHPGREIAGLDPAGGANQLTHRPHQPVGQLECRRDRQRDDDQRPEQQGGVEAQLIGARFGEQALIIREHAIGANDLRSELRVEYPRRVKIGARAEPKLDQGADPVG